MTGIHFFFFFFFFFFGSCFERTQLRTATYHRDQKSLDRPTPMPARTPIDIADLEAALDWSSAGGPFENQAFIGRLTGAVHLQSAHGDFGDELPEDIEDGTRYIAMPHKNDLGLGRALVFEFVGTQAQQLEAQVHSAFRQKGAYGKFKAILERAHLLEQWYAFESAATKAALVRWAEDNGFDVGGLCA